MNAQTLGAALQRLVAASVRTVLNDAAAVVFPADCRACAGPLDALSRVPVCHPCLIRLRPARALSCRRCAEAIDLDLDVEDVRFAGMFADGLLCRVCRAVPPPFERVVSFGTYDGELRTLIHLLKFDGVPAAARVLGGHIASAVAQLDGVAGADLLVVAVPLFRARQRQRGFNQSVLLASEALRRLRKSHGHWRLTASHRTLVRRKRTESQWALSPKGRRRNLDGAFAVEGDVRGREILLVDDIVTSGATARECARVLLRAGATKVWIATLARAQREFIRRQETNPAEYTATWTLPQTLSQTPSNAAH